MRQYLIACTVACCAGAAQAATTELPPAVAQASQHAMAACQEYMHEDADEYRSCIDAVARAIPREHGDTEARLLGHYYYAWVGANNSARLSLPGAERAAQVYLGKFRVLQRKLKVDDKALCKAVPGDCVQRVAIIEQMEAEMRAGGAQALKEAACTNSAIGLESQIQAQTGHPDSPGAPACPTSSTPLPSATSLSPTASSSPRCASIPRRTAMPGIGT